MADIHVKPEELVATGNRLDADVTALQHARTSLHGCALPAGAFGHIPGLSAHLDTTYRDHLDNTTECLQAATDGLDNVVKSLIATGNGFSQQDKAFADHLSSLCAD